MRKAIGLILFIISGCTLFACGNAPETKPSIRQAEGSSADTAGAFAGARIRIIAGDTVLYADLNSSQTSREFVELLPLRLNTIERNGLAKGMTLPRRIFSDAPRTREYELGGMGYWPAGPDIAIFYNDTIYEKTIVEVITMGKVESGVEVFYSYHGPVTIELAE